MGSLGKLTGNRNQSKGQSTLLYQIEKEVSPFLLVLPHEASQAVLIISRQRLFGSVFFVVAREGGRLESVTSDFSSQVSFSTPTHPWLGSRRLKLEVPMNQIHDSTRCSRVNSTSSISEPNKKIANVLGGKVIKSNVGMNQIEDGEASSSQQRARKRQMPPKRLRCSEPAQPPKNSIGDRGLEVMNLQDVSPMVGSEDETQDPTSVSPTIETKWVCEVKDGQPLGEEGGALGHRLGVFLRTWSYFPLGKQWEELQPGLCFVPSSLILSSDTRMGELWCQMRRLWSYARGACAPR
ncbi:hypothetical protein H6P81_009784 [Aristolochia fimbriata]|uniref:Uncharacterized protein n=1 Tax=Aristolochia fimbriata TaxID=158543 RepID=A0AAV7EMT2_ARIFI|nr:hypothetical protein H6P81_009784 [Aristolochia fimbriata]